ncbi:MAG: cytochrome c biogenesis protein ResB [Bacteroidales bacterium]|nr:cytochrome c biogenesis protein ResB [Bacteroidales bacterium]
MWNRPWGYKEGFAINGGLLLVGILLQLAIGRVNLEVLTYPVNLISLVIFGAGLAAMHLASKKLYLFRLLSSFQFALPSMVSVVILVIFMGLSPQFQSHAELPGMMGRLGIMQMLSAWYFVLVFSWFIVILGMVVVKRISRFHIKSDIPFVLNHLGLLIALLCGALGSADIQRLKLTASVGKPEWRAFDSRGNMLELSLAIELHHFTIDKYPPKLMLVDNETGRILPEGKPANILADDDFTEGTLLDWRITVEKRIEGAARVFAGDTIKYVEYPSIGATCALYVKAINTKTHRQQEGWVSCGSFMFSHQALRLDERLSLIMPDREPRRYASDVTVYTQSEKIIHGVIEVNKPLQVEGWKIYQLSYDQSMGKWSTISIFELVRDPWLPAVYAGIWMMLAGAVCMLVFPKKRKEDEV